MAKRVVIRLELDADDVKTGVVTVRGELHKLDGAATASAGKVGLLSKSLNALKAHAAIAGLLALYAAFRQVGQSVRDAGVQEISERKLEQALRNTGEAGGEAAERLKLLASETQRVSNFGDEAILTAQAMLLSFQEVGGARGAEMLTGSLVDMAAGVAKATGETVDLNQVAATLGKSLVQGAGALREYGISLTAQQEAAFKASEGLERVNVLADIIKSNFGGMAAATVDPMRQMQNAMGDLSETAGGPLRDALAQASVRLTVLAQDPGVVAMVRKMGAAFGWLVNATIIAFDAVADTFRGSVIVMRTHVNNIVRLVGVGIRAVENLLVRVSTVAAALGPLAAGISRVAGDMAGAAGRAADAVEGYAESHAAVTAAQRASLQSSREARAAMDALLPSVAAASAATEGAASAAGDLGEALKKTEAGAKNAKTAIDKIRDSIASLRTELSQLRSVDMAELVSLERTRQDLEAELDAIEALVELGVKRARDAEAAARLGAAGMNPAGGRVAGRGLQEVAGTDLVEGGTSRRGLGLLPDRVLGDLNDMERRIREGLKKVRDAIADEREKTAEEARQFGQAIEAGITQGIVNLSAALGEFAAGAASFGDVGREILLSLADLAQRVGGLMVAFGVASLKLRALLSNPLAAIAAGAALIATGAAAKAAIGRAVNSATSGPASGGGGLRQVDPGTRAPVASGLAVGAYSGSAARPASVNVSTNVAAPAVTVQVIGPGMRQLVREVRVEQGRQDRTLGRARGGLSTRDR